MWQCSKVLPLWQFGNSQKTFPATQLLIRGPSGHLHTVNSSPLWESLYKSHLPASGPHTHWLNCIAVWAIQGHDTHCLCGSRSIQIIFHHVLSCFLSVQGNLPFSEGACLILEISSLLLHLPPQGTGFVLLLLILLRLLSSFLRRYIWNPNGTLSWPRSSASIYLMLWENYCPWSSIICGPFIERVAFHICLQFCLLGTSQFFLAISIILLCLTVKQENLVAMN